MSEVLIADLPLNMSEVKGHREVAAYLDVCCLLCDLLSFFFRDAQLPHAFASPFWNRVESG